MGVIDNAVQWATDIANDDSHWYSQDVRWGPHYDCSSFVITAYQNAGVPVKDNGATYTEDMYNVFISCGFKDVTSSCNLSNGAGMLKGDVLLNKADHTALVQADGGTTVEARGNIIRYCYQRALQKLSVGLCTQIYQRRRRLYCKLG